MNIKEIGKDCSGCNSCVQICPKKCIIMEKDSNGFLYPKIDEKMCIDCGICLDRCPIKKEKSIEANDLDCYVAYNKDIEERLTSSSGGIFSLIAKKVLNQGGVVFGAAFNNDFQVKHIYIEEESQLYKLKGSKYVQSEIGDSFIKTKKFLDEGRIVLFSGVACQIEGLKSFLKKDYENLLTIDVLCHGVPSPKVWNKYLNEIRNVYDDKISFINLRDKSKGWTKYSYKVSMNNNIFLISHSDDIYSKVFLSNICLRNSCYSCKFKSFPRCSDITIGDAWEIEKYAKDLNDDKGTSIIIINSKNGGILFSLIKNDLVFRKQNLNTILPEEADSRRSVRKNRNYDLFFSQLDNCSLKELSKYNDDRTLFERIKGKVKRIIKIVLGKK